MNSFPGHIWVAEKSPPHNLLALRNFSVNPDENANCRTGKKYCNLCHTTGHLNSARKTYSAAESRQMQGIETVFIANGHMANMFPLKNQ